MLSIPFQGLHVIIRSFEVGDTHVCEVILTQNDEFPECSFEQLTTIAPWHSMYACAEIPQERDTIFQKVQPKKWCSQRVVYTYHV